MPAVFQRPDGFLKGFLIVFADGHYFAHGPHLSSEQVLSALEFLKGPTGKFDYHVFTPGSVLFKRAVPRANGQPGGTDSGGRVSSGLGRA